MARDSGSFARSASGSLSEYEAAVEADLARMRRNVFWIGGSYSVVTAAAILTVHDALGREVWRHAAPTTVAGPATVTLETARLAAGVYVLRLEADRDVAVRRVVVAR